MKKAQKVCNWCMFPIEMSETQCYSKRMTPITMLMW